MRIWLDKMLEKITAYLANKRNYKTLKLLGISFGVITLIFVLNITNTHLFYVNTTESAPKGIYLICPLSRIKPGDYVSLRTKDLNVKITGLQLPESLLKKVAFMRGEYVLINDQGVFVNNFFICPRPIKKAVTPYFYNAKLPTGFCLLLNDNKDSLDSRHFGPVAIKTLIKVVLVWKL